MHVTRFRQLASALGLVAAVLGTGALAQQEPPPVPPAAEAQAAERSRKVVVLEHAVEQSDPNVRQLQRSALLLAPSSEPGYWIGLQLDPASEALRSQLKIPEGQGLVVTELFPDTPAIKSGFAKHDLIVRVDDQPAADVETFNKVVQAAKDEKELTVVLYRGGVAHSIKVTPAKRPGDQLFSLRVAPAPGQQDVLMEWMPKGLDLEHPMKVEVYNPGLMVRRSLAVKVGDLPKDLSISISKSGDAPAKVSVSKEEQKWEITENELDKLPGEVRGYVERMLGRGPREVREVPVRPHIELIRPGVVMPHPTPHVVPRVAPPPAVAPVAPVAPAAADVDRRLEEMAERLEQLQKAIDALVRQRADETEARPE